MSIETQDVENTKPVFDPDFHTELIIKDEYEDFDSYSRPPVPLGVGGLEVLYADPARYRAGVLSAVAYCGPSGAGSQVVSSVYLLILLV